MNPSSDKRNAPQAIAVSTGERRRKTDGREYDTPPSIPCTPKELDVLLDKWIVGEVFKPNQVSREPTEEDRRDPCFCRLHNYVQHPTIECWALHRLQDQRRDSRTILARSSKKPTPKPQREGCSSSCDLCRSRGGQRRAQPCLLQQLLPYRRVPSSRICSTNWGSQ